MKTEEQIYEQFKEFYTGPLIFGKDEYWTGYLNGYEMGYQDAIEENTNSWYRELGIDVQRYPTGTAELFDTLKHATQEFYKKLEN